jgi:hypothetical protein
LIPRVLGRFLPAFLAFLAFLALLAGRPAWAAGIEMVPYRDAADMAKVLDGARQSFRTAMSAVAAGQADVARAEATWNESSRRYGPGSPDAILARERYEDVKERAIRDARAALEAHLPEIQASAEESRRLLDHIVRDPRQFEALVRGHLKSEASPEAMALLVYAANRKLARTADLVHQKILIGEIMGIQKDVDEVLADLEKVVPLDPDHVHLEDYWPDAGPGTAAGGPVDDLDALLSEDE